ncbi:unnamed protein product [marine sediment metagenome]|uniref:Glycosyltransferase subfamily 4-like N-terminal domain-containing protein n=1 Tax=marine sediment metagenome TaxID=412755 RepID=X1S161_9ZZZZ
MKISILTPDLSSNNLGRAYILAKILQRRYDVEIVGPMFGEGIWEPFTNDKKIQYKSVKFYNKFISIPKLKELYSKINGDVIYAIKPLFNSFTIGLIKKFFTKKPLILDIDDWELGFFIDSYKSKRFTDKIFYILKEPFRFFLKSYESFLWKIINEKLVRFADEIIDSMDKEKKVRVFITNSHSNNRGDEAAQRCMIESIKKSFPQAEIIVATNNPYGLDLKDTAKKIKFIY